MFWEPLSLQKTPQKPRSLKCLLLMNAQDHRFERPQCDSFTNSTRIKNLFRKRFGSEQSPLVRTVTSS